MQGKRAGKTFTQKVLSNSYFRALNFCHYYMENILDYRRKMAKRRQQLQPVLFLHCFYVLAKFEPCSYKKKRPIVGFLLHFDNVM